MSERNARYIDGHWYLPVEDYHELREALSAAVYHADNLARVNAARIVRDLAESRAGFLKAKALLDSLHGWDVQLESARRDPRGISDGCGTN